MVRSQNNNSYDTVWRGECQKFRKEATLAICLSGSRQSKYDLQLTFMPYMKECSLLKEKNDKNTECMCSCPVFEAYKKIILTEMLGRWRKSKWDFVLKVDLDLYMEKIL